MTDEEALKHLDILLVFDAPDISEAVNLAKSALRERIERQNPKPLTLEDLREMDGEPVWISGGGFWALVHTYGTPDVLLIENSGEVVKAEGWMKRMGAIYRTKPDEVKDHE